jgi:hypothetical protein
MVLINLNRHDYFIKQITINQIHVKINSMEIIIY